MSILILFDLSINGSIINFVVHNIGFCFFTLLVVLALCVWMLCRVLSAHNVLRVPIVIGISLEH